MWLLKLLAVFIQISGLLALGHPGKFYSNYFIKYIFSISNYFPIKFELDTVAVSNSYTYIKGQKISKGYCSVFNSPEKRKKNILRE